MRVGSQIPERRLAIQSADVTDADAERLERSSDARDRATLLLVPQQHHFLDRPRITSSSCRTASQHFRLFGKRQAWPSAHSLI